MFVSAGTGLTLLVQVWQDLLKKGIDDFLQEDASDEQQVQRGVMHPQCFIPICS